MISPNRIETAALRGLFLHPVAMAHRPVEAANEARRAEFGRRRGTSRHGRSGALALTGRLALPIDYAMHRHNRGPNPRLESPASGAQRGLTRVDRNGAAALGGVENEPISRGCHFGAQRKCRRSARVRRDDNRTAGSALLQPTRGLCVAYAWLMRGSCVAYAWLMRGLYAAYVRLMRVDRTQAAAVDCRRNAFAGRFLPRYAEAPNNARTRARSVGVSTPGGGASFVVSTAMRSPCQSARSCSSASPSSIGATDSVG